MAMTATMAIGMKIFALNGFTVPPDDPPEGDYALFLPGASSDCKIYPVRKVEEVARALRDIGLSSVLS